MRAPFAAVHESAFDPFETLASAQPQAIEPILGHFQYADLTRYEALSFFGKAMKWHPEQAASPLSRRNLMDILCGSG
jgi:hypothetical protein